jgi:hypothetical protein
MYEIRECGTEDVLEVCDTAREASVAMGLWREGGRDAYIVVLDGGAP